MIDLSHLQGRSVAVLGLGKSGTAAIRALKAAGVEVAAWDDKVAGRSFAEREGVPVRDFAAEGMAGIDLVMLSPGIPRTHPRPHPAVARALEAGSRLVGDIDLLAEARPEAGFLGVTGTNGKSTTTALLQHVFEAAGIDSEAGGNLGPAALGLRPVAPGGWYVLEVSSYQLETITEVPWSIGVFINITPDHLDRYADMAGYVAAKTRLLNGIRPGGTAVIGVDDDYSRAVFAKTKARPEIRVIPISAERTVEGGVFVRDFVLYDATEGAARAVLDLRQAPALPGAHNGQNAACVWAAARAAGVAEDVLAAAIRTFPGLAHRQQLVGTIAGIRFVNDSKGTNPDAAAKALGSYETIYWIAGGRPKEGGLEAVDPYLPRVAQAFLIGEGTPKFAAHLDGKVPYQRSTDLDAAIEAAYRAAVADGATGAVVLLSPACASFDQFANFEARGEAFAASVKGLQVRVERGEL
ncbi:UDP-N-acetylmuramoyl-L-alanine--D-glutamate ligase [Inquilinus sp. YAF38]|uniref:UDP-N-acetylmuramoyl-L-alanine--D-glutamate ligase n=1 Tax=Inquilinus sp. YAF38 TaxID=3233084 RepID=UPI003F8DD7AC